MKKKTRTRQKDGLTSVSFVEMYGILHDRVSPIMDEMLLPLGFEHEGKSRWERNTPHLRQSFSLFGDRCYIHLRYGYKILDEFDNFQERQMNQSTFDYAGGDAWMVPLETRDVPEHVDKAVKIIKSGITLFQKYKSIKTLLRAYEKGLLDENTFGEDIGWRNYTLGSAYFYIKEYDKAIDYFQVAVKYSRQRLGFIVKRKKAALHWIEHVQGVMEKSVKPKKQ